MIKTTNVGSSYHEIHGKRQKLLDEWQELETRQHLSKEINKQINDLTTKKQMIENNPAVKKRRIDDNNPSSSSSSSSSSSRPEPIDTELEEINVEETNLRSQLANIKLSYDESNLFKSFLPFDLSWVKVGSIFIGFKFKDDLVSSNTQNPCSVDEENYLLSIEDVAYMYALDKHVIHEEENNTTYFRRAYQNSNFQVELHEQLICEDEAEDNVLMLTEHGLAMFNIEDLLQEDPTQYAISKKLEPQGVKRYLRPVKVSSVKEQTHEKVEASVSSPRIQTQQTLQSNQTNLNTTNTTSNQSIVSVIKDVLESNQPAAIQIQAKDAERSRLFLLRVTLDRENIFEVLGSGANATLKETNWLSELFDKFVTNTGGTDVKSFQKIPLMANSKCIQQFIQGKIPENLVHIQWDHKQNYGSFKLCFAHFLESISIGDAKGFPCVPYNPTKLTNLFSNLSIAFQGCFDKRLLTRSYNDSILTINSIFWKNFWLKMISIARDQTEKTDLNNMQEYKLAQYLQKFLHELFEHLSSSDSNLLLLVKGLNMVELLNSTKEFLSQTMETIHSNVETIYEKYWNKDVLEKIIESNKKGFQWTFDLSKKSVSSTYKEMLLTDSQTVAETKKTKSITPSDSSSQGGRGGRGRGRGGYQGRGQGTNPYTPNTQSQMANSNASVLTTTTYPQTQQQVLICVNHLKHLFNPATLRGCNNFNLGKCNKLHPNSPTDIGSKLTMLKEQFQHYTNIPIMTRNNIPNEARAQALQFIPQAIRYIENGTPYTGTI